MKINTSNPSPRPETTVRAFTLIELLVVISIIAVLAAFVIPVVGALKIRQYKNHTQAELDLLNTAIERYKADYGFYPPANGTNTPVGAMTNQLYYELVGTTYGPVNGGTYTNLDGGDTITAAQLGTYFNISGLMNCTQSSGEEAKKARNYLSDLRPGQTAEDANGVKVLSGSISGLDPQYQPMPGFTNNAGFTANPFRYVNPGTNNPGSYDLWIQLQISGKKYLICNWSKQIVINSPLP